MNGGLEPVEILHVRDHAFVKPEIRPSRGRGPCASCGERYGHLAHLGAPQSLNVAGSGGNRFAYQRDKKDWQKCLTDLLIGAQLPTGLARVFVEGQVCFPDRIRRDQGNFRYLLEKALGDALTAGGWLEDDDWERYEFGQLARTYELGVSWTRLIIFPTPAEPESIAA
jgi:hypothetical protein